MTSADTTLANLDWTNIVEHLNVEGYAMLPGLIDAPTARGLTHEITTSSSARRVCFSSKGLGRGELFYFEPSLPAALESLRACLYTRLAAVANQWGRVSGDGSEFPADFADFIRQNKNAGQMQGQSHMNRMVSENYLGLHQSNAGAQVFPLQVVALLSDPGKDFVGGEFVMTEQRPRMQSRPIVIPLTLGDAAIISTAARPFKGSKGYYRVNSKHAISRVRQGERIGVELTFHNAADAACDGHVCPLPVKRARLLA